MAKLGWSVMVAVSATDHVISQMSDQARKIVLGRDVGPVISKAAKERMILAARYAIDTTVVRTT